jgi:hypothetical protein
VADCVEHVPDLPVAPFSHGDAQLGAAFLPARQQLDLGGLRATAVDRHAPGETFDVVPIGDAHHEHVVDASDAMTRVRELRGEIAVVGQQQQSVRIEIEAPDGVHVFTNAVQQVDDRRPPLRVRSRRDISARLVKEKVPVPIGELDSPAVHAHIVVRRVRFGSELAHRDAVDRDPPLDHQLLGCATRRDTRPGQNFLQSFH